MTHRAFLAVTNGWHHISSVYKLWSTDKAEWFSVRHQEDRIDPWVHPSGLPDSSSTTIEQHCMYGDEQDCCVFREEYLQTALEISDVGDVAIYLLNPRIVTPEGEWEAWFFANWNPGATRYRSFQEMMQAKYQEVASELNGVLPFFSVS